jgi:2,4-dienoyl-CoA reductase-like NADH-dependent reductase (Old Yellow Enzyme family)
VAKTMLFSEYRLRDVPLKNRIVVSPMWQYSGQNWCPTDWHLMNLGRLSAGGAALVFQEGTTIERRGCGTRGDLGIWDNASIPAFARIVAMIRANGAVPGIQLMHAGRKARTQPPTEGGGPLDRTPDMQDWDRWELIAPSAIPQAEGFPVPRPMTRQDIVAVTDAWISAARRADQAGYDVLNIHGGHGYLLHQFLSPASNVRTDAYGGGFDNRVRLFMEVVEGVRAVWPASKPIVVRLSCIDGAGWMIEDTIRLVKRLASAGVDLIDCSSGGMGGPVLSASVYGYQVELAATVRRETGVPTSAVGLIVHAAQAERVLVQGAADLVVLARELIYNPNWPIDAAQKLNDDAGFSMMPRKSAFWLQRRAANMPDLRPSTYSLPE